MPETSNTRSPVVNALVTKHAELAGMIQFHQREIERIGHDLKHLDATLKLFSPEIDLRSIGIVRQRRSAMGGFKFFKPGESHRLILDVLREHGARLQTTEIIGCIAQIKGWDETTKTHHGLSRTVIGSLRRLEQRGMVKSFETGQGRALAWELA